jgi:Ca2+-binding EF-hand superfamily protein
MRSRAELLKDLVLLQGNIESLEIGLSKFAWDSETPLYSISIDDFIFVLKRSLNDEIDFKTLIIWANVLECRDDLEFEKEELQEWVFELANPEINGKITKERLQEIVNILQEQSLI